ncbi:cytochrome P450 [Phlegmacium glaucopus]|nr:cytochrome P450 [Phlegmacium glaucopus]
MLGTAFHHAFAVTIFMAIVTHIWYRNNEPRSLVLPAALITILCIASTAFLLPHLESYSIAFSLAFGTCTYLATLLGSISLYRLSPLHPLAKYPGPTRCKLTKFWMAWISFGGRAHIYYKKLHDKYGPIVRIGPNELSIINVELIPYILGPQGMPKGPMWDGRRLLSTRGGELNHSLTGVRDLRLHAQLRKPWNNAFQSAALVDYEDMLVKRAAQLMTQLQNLCDDEICVDLANQISSFSFVYLSLIMSMRSHAHYVIPVLILWVISRIHLIFLVIMVAVKIDFDLRFGGVYSLMRDGDGDGILPTLKRGLFLPSIIQHVPWCAPLLRTIPFFGNDTRSLRLFAIKQSQKRAAQPVTNRKDLFSYLLEATKADATASPHGIITANSLLAIIAGSDTTASVLSNIVYYLICNPEYQQRLRDEFDESLPLETDEPIKSNLLATLPFLNAVINEALRLQPPVPTSLQRAPPIGSSGKVLGSNMIITEGTAILVPPYAIHRDPRYFFPHPDKFWPDRWLKKDFNIILERNAFIPFSTGSANCPGKPLAMMELRLVTCLLVKTFELSFDDGYDPSLWEEELLDRFVMLKGKLPVKLKARSS